MSDFKPSVVAVSEREWVGTMPHDVRQKAWYRAFDIQNYVVELDSSPTELFVSVNKGHHPREGLAIMVTAIYLAMNNINDLLAKNSIEEHIKAMKDQIEFHYLILPSEVSPYLKQYLHMNIKAVFDTKKKSFSSIIEDNVESLLRQAKKAKNRLSYFPASPETISGVEKSTRQRYCDLVIAQIETALKEAKDINSEIKKIKEKVSDEINNWLTVNDSQIFACGLSLKQILNRIEKLSKNANTLVDNFIKSYEINKLVESVLDICPPEK